MLKGKTNSGFKFEIPEERVDNYELLEAVSEIDENPMAIVKVLKLLLGKEDVDRLKEHVRTQDGIVPAKKLVDEIGEIFQSKVETKNS